jgi:hypothetical protein
MARQVRTGIVLVATLVFFTPSMLRHPTTGQVVRCHNGNLLTWPFENHWCIREYERLGFERVRG